ncbi:C-C motif chemokine 21 [Sphaerodactylus townsendi]|uniref:Uncharacterized protein n=1 Tax=Sphaerodactylus townsendi TaxID=933632 RepID=A0ACB8EPE0_9SAUR|nr:C-C motif chemokine 21 [Sphaerodactylus townsendi]
MAPRPTVVLLALLAAALLALLAGPGNADSSQDCCLKVPPPSWRFSQKMKDKLVDYRIQDPSMGCQLEAIVFITKKGRELCISPHAAWASGLKRKIDARNRRRQQPSARGSEDWQG